MTEKTPAAPPPGRTQLREQQRALIQRYREQEEEGGEGEFYIDPDRIPEGMSYEWKRYYNVYQKPDEKYRAKLKRMGWLDVPARRHPEIFGAGFKGEDEFILHNDMVLMERPVEFTIDARKHEFRKAKSNVQDQSEKLRISTHALLPRVVQKKSRHYAAVDIPEDE